MFKKPNISQMQYDSQQKMQSEPVILYEWKKNLKICPEFSIQTRN